MPVIRPDMLMTYFSIESVHASYPKKETSAIDLRLGSNQIRFETTVTSLEYEVWLLGKTKIKINLHFATKSDSVYMTLTRLFT